MKIENIDTTMFLLEAMENINSSLELNTMLENTYAFLQKYFPLAAMSMHKYLEDKKVMRALFYIDENGCKTIANDYKMNSVQVEVILDLHKSKIFKSDYAKNSPMYEFMKENYLSILGNNNPHFLGTALKSSTEVVGQLIFFAKKSKEFTKKEQELFTLLQSTFTSTMINIHHHNELLESREHLIHENIKLKKKNFTNQDVIGKSQEMKKVLDMVEILAKKDVQILVLGETGTGKEVIANILQEKSKRKDNIFLKVNCGAIPESLIDSELFGYEKGAFTGAFSTKKGYFEQADGGTLFLDEIGELSMQAQVRLLRVLQFGLIERVGGKQSIPVDVRIIAATNRNLENMLHLGTFREDLYYRLHAFPIKIPSLRERKEDIPLLLGHFIKKYAKKNHIRAPRVEHSSLGKLIAYTWPGNVRELENTVERCMTLSTANIIDFAKYLSKDPKWYMENNSELTEYNYTGSQSTVLSAISKEEKEQFIKEIAQEVSKMLGLEAHSKKEINEKKEIKSIEEFMKEQIREALRESKGRICGKNSAAEILGLNCKTLRKRMEKLDLISRDNW